MARIRTIKPELFRHEGLFELERDTGFPIRTAWMGLFTACDREGRFRWQPRTLKLDILPWDEVDMGRVLDALATRGFVVRYEFEGDSYGYIPSWEKHQVINNREKASEIPAPPPKAATETVVDASPTRESSVGDESVSKSQRVEHAPSGEGKGREGKGKEGEGASPSSSSRDALDEFLSDSSEEGRSELRSVYGNALIREQIPQCKAQWLLDTERQRVGGKALYARRWLERAAKNAAAETKKAPRPSDPAEDPIVAWQDTEHGKIAIRKTAHDKWIADFKSGRCKTPAPPLATGAGA